MEPTTPQRFHPAPEHGLTAEQVRRRYEAGLHNRPPETITKSTREIFRENICTLFNLYNLIIAVALVLVGAWTNLFFVLLLVLNTAIGIFQELHAKHLVDKLSLLSIPHAAVVRDGRTTRLPIEQLVLDDVILLESGGQISADAVLLDGEIEANESLLTGESDAVAKRPGDHVLSGSFVVSGKCRAQVEHIGDENFATRLSQEAKQHKKVHSELLTSMQRVTKFTGYLILPLGMLLFAEAFWLQHLTMYDSVVTTAASLLGMLPKGLVLLISVSLAIGVIKLARCKVLVQDLYSLETLAHVDILCLDKTGTITEGRMKVERVVPLSEEQIVPFEPLIGSFLQHTDDNNATFQALSAAFPVSDHYFPVSKVAFSSQRKWSAVTFEGFGTLVLGAPERLMDCPLPAELIEAVSGGARVIVAGFTAEPVSANEPLPPITPLQAILLSDPVRENAVSTLAYFKNEGVQIKVISGDNPAAVSAIAARAGLEGAEAFIDMSSVDSEEALTEAARTCTVFGRVSPAQKKQLVKAMQAEGHSVAMTGDGVNDILALREADCSVAIAEGSDAARQVSQLVLLNSDFASLPSVLGEGRRVVNNITRVASIFFVKTVYSVLLSVVCILCNMPFPFLPIQITLIDAVVEAYPAFLLSFEPSTQKIRGTFLREVLRRCVPNAVATTVAVVLVMWVAPIWGYPPEEVSMLMYLMVGVIGIAAVFKTCVPPNFLRMFVFFTMTAAFFVMTILFYRLLELPLLSLHLMPVFFGFTAFSILVERLCALACNRIWGIDAPPLQFRRKTGTPGKPKF